MSIPFVATVPASGYGVAVNLQSPLIQETEAGTVVTATFFIANTTAEKQTFLVKVDLPSGWITIPFEEPFFSLEPGETTVEWLSFRVPKEALAGPYTVTYTIQGREDPSLLSQASFTVEVLGTSVISSALSSQNVRLLAGDSYESYVTIQNRGNVKTDVEVKVKELPELMLLLEGPSRITLDPMQTKKIALKGAISTDIEELKQYFIYVSVEDLQTHHTEYLSTKIEAFPIKKKKSSEYHTLPMSTTFGYGMKNSKIEGFIEQKGSGSLDGKKDIDFFARIPLKKQANVDRDLGGLPENGYLHIWDSWLDLYGGDGNYTMTPLLMLSRFGTGGSLQVSPDPTSYKIVYVKDTSSVPQSTLGGVFSFNPITYLKVSLSSMHTEYTKQSEKIIDAGKHAWTSSLSADLEAKKIGSLTMEYAEVGNPLDPQKRDSGYYLYSKGQFGPSVWSAVQAIYAGADFVGYYQDTKQLYTSVGFPIVKRLQGNLSYNGIAYNLDKNRKKKQLLEIIMLMRGFLILFLSVCTPLVITTIFKPMTL